MLIYLVGISHIHFSLLWYAFLMYSPGLHLIWWKLVFLEMMRLFTVKEACFYACTYVCMQCMHMHKYMVLVRFSMVTTWQQSTANSYLHLNAALSYGWLDYYRKGAAWVLHSLIGSSYPTVLPQINLISIKRFREKKKSVLHIKRDGRREKKPHSAVKS